MLLVGAQIAYASFSLRQGFVPSQLPWVPIQVGKSKTYTHKTQDASMFIEASRRRAIKGGNTYGRNIDPRVNFWQRGSTNGTLETFFISAVCPALSSVFPSAILYDGGTAENENRPIYDAGTSWNVGGVVLDFGDATYEEGQDIQNVCPV